MKIQNINLFFYNEYGCKNNKNPYNINKEIKVVILSGKEVII